jgi:glycosyltransferase involved in cell wall biosynthesis
MNIVHIEDFVHPDAGYQLNILPKYMVKQGHSVYIVTSQMDKVSERITSFFGKENINARDKEFILRTGVNIIRLPVKGFVSSRAVFTRNLFRRVEALKPDIIYVHGNDTLTAMRYLIKLKKLSYPIVFDSHMLEMASVSRFNKIYRALYKKYFTPIIIKNKIPIIRTQDDPYVEKFLGIPLKQCPWISIGSDTLLFHPDEVVKSEFREANNIGNDDFVILYTGKLDKAKGGMLLAQSFQYRFKTKKNIVLIVVGNTNGEYGQKVEEIFQKSENRIIRFSTQKYLDLAKFYQSADLSIFPKQCSLSFFDAQACGLPVVSEDNNINIDRLQYNNGFYFKSGDVKDFRNKIIECAEMPENEYKQLRQNAFKFIKNNYDYESISKQYTDILLNEVKRFESENGYK